MKVLTFAISVFFISLSLVFMIESAPVSDYKDTIEYLNNFEYLSNNEKESLKSIIETNQHIRDDKRFKRALKNLQRNGNIPITGRIDDDTLSLMKRPRCGVGDKVLNVHRHKRYAFMSSKWHRNNLTWRYIPKGQFLEDEDNIRRIIKEALSVWEQDTVMKFTEVPEGQKGEDPDLIISFEKPKHTDVDPYSFGANTLGHAFQPGKGLGGDAHFNNAFSWDFKVSFDSKPDEGKFSFFGVALHELGHSLGLAHSRVEDAVMYEFYSRSTARLAEDDIRGMQSIYGTPPNRKYKPPKKYESEEEMPVWGSEPMKPDRCNTSYDALAYIDGKLNIFRGKYVFGPEMNMTEFSKIWMDLPANSKNIDAVYQKDAKTTVFFIGQFAYIYTTKLYRQISLKSMGISESVERVDAVFNWPTSWSKNTYILSGSNYWILDKETMKVTDGPKRITSLFRDVFEIDTAFVDDNGHLFFFRDDNFYEFDKRKLVLNRTTKAKSAVRFMNCVDLMYKFGEDDDPKERKDGDFINHPGIKEDDLPSLAPEIMDKLENEGGGASNIKETVYLVAAFFISVFLL